MTLSGIFLESKAPIVGSQQFLRRDGTPVAVTWSLAPVPQNGRVTGAVLVFRDVPEAQEPSGHPGRQAMRDPLTGLANWPAFEKKLEELLDDARLPGRQHALCYLDLDQFKLINDVCGHAAGDRLLQELEPVLRAELREQDFLARLGSDEFGVLLVDTPLAQAVSAADRLCAGLQSFNFSWKGRKYGVGASIGVVPITAQAADAAELLVAADMACYVAKESGRNRVHVSPPDDRQVLRHRSQMQWASRIREALDENRFQLVFEPMVDLKSPSATPHHFEILVRMRDGEAGPILPGTFIPAAERYQMMAAVDLWVLRTLLQFLPGLPMQTVRPEQVRFAVNLSGNSVGSPRLLNAIRETIIGSGVPPASLVFEITETAAIHHLDESIRWVNSLKELGCRFSLDDFGSGLSSYAYLKNLPVDYLKIDGGFIRRLDQDPLSRAIVGSINDIGHQIGLRTIAEHVENDGILSAVREMGIDYAQGYRVGRARPLAELADVLK